MAPSLRGIGSGSASGTGNISVTTDVGATDGDLILIVTDVNTSFTFPSPACTGFTPMHDSPNSTYNRLSLLGRIASGNGTSYTITNFTLVDGSSAATVLIIKDWEGTTLPTNIVSALDSGSNTTNTIPAITMAAANSMDLAIVGFGGNNDYGTPPNFASWGDSLAELADIGANVGGFYYAGMGVAAVTRVSAGLQAATSVTADTADVSTAIRLEIKAAGGAATKAPTPKRRRTRFFGGLYR